MTSSQRGNLTPDNLIKPDMRNGSLPLSVADLLVNVSPQKRKVLLSIVMVRGLPNLTKPHIGNLTKPDIETAVMLTNVDIETARMMTNDDILTAFSCVREGERVSDGMKKGSTDNAALCALTTYNRVSRSYAVQASGLDLFRWRRLISLFTAVTINCAFVSPSSNELCISLTTSCGNRALICCDLLFVELVAIAVTPFHWWDSVYAKKATKKGLRCDSLRYIFNVLGAIHLLRAMPRSAPTQTGHLTTTVIRGNSYGYQS